MVDLTVKVLDALFDLPLPHLRDADLSAVAEILDLHAFYMNFWHVLNRDKDEFLTQACRHLLGFNLLSARDRTTDDNHFVISPHSPLMPLLSRSNIHAIRSSDWGMVVSMRDIIDLIKSFLGVRLPAIADK